MHMHMGYKATRADNPGTCADCCRIECCHSASEPGLPYLTGAYDLGAVGRDDVHITDHVLGFAGLQRHT